MEPLSVVLIERNRLAREGLRHILAEAGVAIVAEGADADALAGPVAPPPEIVLACTEMPVEWVDDELPRLRRQFGGARIVLLAPEAAIDLLALFAAPVDGVITEQVSVPVLLKTLELVHAGERVMPARLVAAAIAGRADPGDTAATVAAAAPELSQREAEILRHLVRGEPNKAIAALLGIAEATAKVHVKAILRKLGVQNRTQAALEAVRRGIVRPCSP